MVTINTSLKAPVEVLDFFSLPAVPYLTNYQQAWSQIGRTFLNSVLITAPGVAFSVLLGAIAGFPLLQLKGRGGFVIYLFLPTGMLVPYQIVQIPLFALTAATRCHGLTTGRIHRLRNKRSSRWSQAQKGESLVPRSQRAPVEIHSTTGTVFC
ncbi:carbohydrate ABC transporter permease [Rhizobium leguminosarum]|uniref:hypothetical protein n=1 Tax=Rhizobium leguminosarum TaxID=384 RepID=UPI001C98A3C2|nr:hypothetical protein [Rhizobium leguminosarum]MBY5720613.1 carbohydrate ABC transporter permease [Rhizobium leguminosarum]